MFLDEAEDDINEKRFSNESVFAMFCDTCRFHRKYFQNVEKLFSLFDTQICNQTKNKIKLSWVMPCEFGV